MDKALALVLMFVASNACAVVSSGTYTTYYDLWKSEQGDTSYVSKNKTNLNTIDSQLYALTTTQASVIVSTGSIYSLLNATASALTTETASRIAADSAIGVDTASIYSLLSSTASSLTAEIAARVAGDSALGVSTSSIYSSLNSTASALTEEIARATLRENQIGESTGTIYAALSATASLTTDSFAIVNSTTSELYDLLHATASATTDAFAVVNSTTAELYDLLHATASYATNKFAEVDSTTTELYSLLHATASATTDAFVVVDSTTSELYSLLWATASYATDKFAEVDSTTTELYNLLNATASYATDKYAEIDSTTSEIYDKLAQVAIDTTTIPDSALSTNVGLLDRADQTWTGVNTHTSSVTINAAFNVSGDTFVVSGGYVGIGASPNPPYRLYIGDPSFIGSLETGVNNTLGPIDTELGLVTITGDLVVNGGIGADTFSGSGTYITDIQPDKIASGSMGSGVHVDPAGVDSSTITARFVGIDLKIATAAYLADSQTFTGVNTYSSSVTVNEAMLVTGTLTASGGVAGNVTGDLTGNADTATSVPASGVDLSTVTSRFETVDSTTTELYGKLAQVAIDTATIPAANIAAGSLGVEVIASSLAVNSVYADSLVALSVTDAKINDVAPGKISAGSLDSDVIASSVAVNSVKIDAIDSAWPVFSAYMGAVQSVASGSAVKLQFTTSTYDVGNFYDEVNYRFLPTRPGYYRISSYAIFGAVADGKKAVVYLYKNGALVKFTQVTTGVAESVIPLVTAVLYLDGDDYVEVYGEHNHGSNRDVGSTVAVYSDFSGELIR